MFQRIWSGHVISERAAFELLSLIDQIHLWAITVHRTFVLEHLRPWHELCDKNYLLEWDSIYDPDELRKRRRVCSEIGDINVPSWVAHLTEPAQRNIQYRAKASLVEALKKEVLRKSKAPCRENPHSLFGCVIDGCTAEFGSCTAMLDHMQSAHDMEESSLAQIRWLVRSSEIKDEVEKRQKQNIMASGKRWPWPWSLAENVVSPTELRSMDMADPRYANWQLFRSTTRSGSGSAP